MRKFDVSVVIPAYNEEEAIGLCLDSLTKQKTKRSYEVIVVNNNSTDNTAHVAASFKKKLNLRLVIEKKKGRGMARFRGFEEAKAPIIFSTDADSILPPHWIEDMASALESPDVVAVTTPCVIDDTSKKNREIVKNANRALHELYMLINGHSMVYGYSFAVKKPIYIKAGKINKDLKSLDDIEFGMRVSKYGKITYLKSLHVTVSNRRFRESILRGLFSYTKPFFQTIYLKKSADMSDIR